MLTTTLLLRMVASLAVTLGLVVLAAYAYKRLGQPLPQRQGSKRMHLQETLRLNPQTTLHLVRVDDTEHLLAVTNAQTTIISTAKTSKTK